MAQRADGGRGQAVTRWITELREVCFEPRGVCRG
jgi:hypothetical protein